MASPGQDFSRFQRGVIQRYYEHADTIALQKLSEIVSDLYLAEGGHATKLWNNARQALAKLAPADDPHVLKVLSVRSVTGLAKLVTELSAGAKAAGSETRSTEGSEPTVGNDFSQSASTPVARVSSTQAPASASAPSAAPATSPTVTGPPTPEQLKHAMKAFRKRLKLTRLDDESRLGRVGNPMSGGKRSEVMAIIPPREYSKAVWDELVKQGKLKSSGGSFYQLAEG